MWVRYNKNAIDTHNLSSFHNHPVGIMPTSSQLRKMSLGGTWFDWGPGAAGWRLWAQDPGLSGSNVLPFPCTILPHCSPLTHQRSTVCTKWGVLVTVDKTRWSRFGSPKECVTWFHAEVQLHDKETCMENPTLGARSISTERRKWGQWSTRNFRPKNKRKLGKCLWECTVTLTARCSFI